MQPHALLSWKVFLLGMSGWALSPMPQVWAQQSPYFYQCQEQEISVLRLAKIADTAGLHVAELESLLPRQRTISRQWYDAGEGPTVEWYYTEASAPWESPLEGLRWTPHGAAYLHRGRWITAPEAPVQDAPPGLFYADEGALIPTLFVSKMLPTAEELAQLGAQERSPSRWQWEAGKGLIQVAQSAPPRWEWWGPDSSSIIWEFAPHAEGFYVAAETSSQPRTLHNGTCAQVWRQYLRSSPVGSSGQQSPNIQLVISPNPRQMEPVQLALQPPQDIRPQKLEWIDINGRVAWELSPPLALPTWVSPPLPPGRYTIRATFGPYVLQQPFVQL